MNSKFNFTRESDGALYLLQDSPEFTSLSQVAEVSIDLLKSLDGITAMVFGPVWSICADTVEDNIDLLDFYSRQLSEKGHHVLHSPSLLAVAERVAKEEVGDKYRQEIVPNVTGPIIKEAGIKKAFFLNCGPDSINTLIEKGLAEESEETEVYDLLQIP